VQPNLAEKYPRRHLVQPSAGLRSIQHAKLGEHAPSPWCASRMVTKPMFSIPWLAALVGICLWIWGLTPRRHQRVELSTVRGIEYWWSFTAFLAGGIVPLIAVGALPVFSDQRLLIQILPLSVLGGILVLNSVRNGARLTALSWTLLIVFLIYAAFCIGGDSLLMPIASFFMFLPAIVTPANGYSLQDLKSGAAAGTRWLLVIFAFCLIAFPAPIGACRLDKCSIWGQALGPLGTGNSLGVVLAVLGAVSLLAASTRQRALAVLGGSFLLVDLTSSRSGFTTWMIGLGVLIMYKICVHFRSRLVALLTLVGVTAAAVAVPLWDWGQGDFSGRVELWRAALDKFSESPIFGFGPSFWVRQTASSELNANYSTHNLFTELLMSAGLVGVLSIAVGLVLASRASQGVTASLYVVALIVVWIGSSLSEVTSAPGRLYLFPGLLVFVMAVAHARESTVQRDLEHAKNAGGHRTLGRKSRAGAGSVSMAISPINLGKAVGTHR
jgi:O-antigen ligase